MPRSNSESVYLRIMMNNAIVLNHSPNIDTKAASQNRRYVRLVFTKRIYELPDMMKTYSSSALSLSCEKETTIHFDVGVFDLSATESSGTNSFASGK